MQIKSSKLTDKTIIDANAERTQMLGLSEKDFKTAIIKMLQQVIHIKFSFNLSIIKIDTLKCATTVDLSIL